VPADDVHLDLAARLLDHARLLEEAAELERRPIEGRNLGLHLDQQVGHAVAVRGREQVLDRLGAEAVPEERGRIAGRVGELDARLDVFSVARLWKTIPLPGGMGWRITPVLTPE
jgi:hypothetical protein